jgi:exodeoxyribonuclease VII small subunit
MEQKANAPFSFETSLSRLEQILEKMNSGATPLDEAVTLYEEADKLIAGCSKKLIEAERKIEVLMKNRSGEAVVDKEGKPATEPFQGMGK